MSANDTQPTPYEIAQKIFEDSKAAYDASLLETDIRSHNYHIAEKALEYWSRVSPTALNSNAIGGTALASLHSIQQQAANSRMSALSGLVDAQQMYQAFSGYGTITNTVHDFVYEVSDYSSDAMRTIVNWHQQYESYAQRYERFERNLGRIYRQILEIQQRTTSYPHKSILPDARQAFDTLMKKLVPSDETVKNQTWWPAWEQHRGDPSKVSTPQRIRYAAETYIRDPNLQNILIDQSRHTLEVHRKLSELYHETDEIDDEKAQNASQNMLTILNQWADALEI